ncbi:hypothetical protein DL98DRAFT_570286 [Cadophora sp. DSE1049]|nr:hypothetical protein DL98DRAFT_570286 [Cadophora sp. DSE1049]
MLRSSARETRLPARYRDENEIPNFARMTSTEKKTHRKQVKKKKSAPTEPAPAPERGGDSRPGPAAIVQSEAVTSPTTTATLPSSPIPDTPSLDWRSIERYAPLGADRPIKFNGRDYPFNRWNLLRPGLIFALLHVLSRYFILSDTIKLLHLQEHEIEDLEEILQPEKRGVWVVIHDDEVVYAKRILLANIEDEKLVGELCGRLDAYAGVTTCLEEIESGKFDRLDQGRAVNGGADMDAGE